MATTIKPLLAALPTLLFPLPALADVSAHYAAGERTTLTVEADESGNWRIEVAGRSAILRRSGIDYLVVHQPKGGPKVFELKQVAAEIGGTISAASEEDSGLVLGLVPNGEAVVAGYRGEAWKIVALQGSEADRRQSLELVMTSDVALAPVAEVFRHAANSISAILGKFMPDSTGFGSRIVEALAKGTPLRASDLDGAKPAEKLIELKSIDTGEIDPRRFELPAPVSPAAEFAATRKAMLESKGPKEP